MGLTHGVMTFGKGGRVTLLLLLATVLQHGGSQIICNIEIDTKRGLWRETTPQQAATNEAEYCKGYTYTETGQTSRWAPNEIETCTVYDNADTQWPCLATCKEACTHGYKCLTDGTCPCTQENLRYRQAKMCVPLGQVANCHPFKVNKERKCEPFSCEDTCPNGRCDGAGKCTCLEGFNRDSKTGKCVPNACAEACGGGTCHTYDECTCQDGSVVGPKDEYKCTTKTNDHGDQEGKNGPTNMQDLCKDITCENGKCERGECQCNTGYKKVPGNKHCDRIVCPDKDPTNYCQGQCQTAGCSSVGSGWCDQQGECQCNPGYKKDLSYSNKCNRIVCPERDPTNYCQDQCHTSTCTARGSGWCDQQGECQCNTGYKKDLSYSNKCNRIVCPERDPTNYCQDQCHTSTCTARGSGRCDQQGECQCNTGYKKDLSYSNKCNRIVCPERDPMNYCQGQCQTSTCTARGSGRCDQQGECQCNTGYKKDLSYSNKCNRIVCPERDPTNYCQGQCHTSTCTARGSGRCDQQGECQCNIGYKKKANSPYQCDQISCPSFAREDDAFCEAQCNENCKNGTCAQDGTCTCFYGYKKSTQNNYKCDLIYCPSYVWEDKVYCKAQCNANCHNGACDQYGTCTCNNGFKLSPRNIYQCNKIFCPSYASEDDAYCKTQCDKSCSDGWCNYRGVCTCNDGFKRNSNIRYQCDKIFCPSDGEDDLAYCAAQCSQHCHNGTCYYGGHCACKDGFKKEFRTLYKCNQIGCPSSAREDDSYCTTECNKYCTDGTCDDIGNCNCNNGFTKDTNKEYECARIKCPSTANKTPEWGFCKTVCESQCGQGVCDEVGVCNCNDGFKKRQGEGYNCSKIRCPALDTEDYEYCLKKCNSTCKNGKCNVRGACKCDESFIPTNQTFKVNCHHECNEDGSCSLGAILGGIVGVGFAIIVAIIVAAAVMIRTRNRKERAEKEQGETQEIPLETLFEEPEYVNSSQEVETAENSSYQSFDWQPGRRRVQ